VNINNVAVIVVITIPTVIFMFNVSGYNGANCD
jgi:hypothetical protein